MNSLEKRIERRIAQTAVHHIGTSVTCTTATPMYTSDRQATPLPPRFAASNDTAPICSTVF